MENRTVLTYREGIVWWNQQKIPKTQRTVIGKNKVLISGILTKEIFQEWSNRIGQAGEIEMPSIEYQKRMKLYRVTIVSKMNDVIKYYFLFKDA